MEDILAKKVEPTGAAMELGSILDEETGEQMD